MFYGVHHVTSAGFALGADHRRAFGDTPQGLAQIARTADKWRLESMLVHVVSFVSWGKDFGFINVIHAQRLQDLRFSKMPDAAFGHHGNGYRFHDLADLF